MARKATTKPEIKPVETAKVEPVTAEVKPVETAVEEPKAEEPKKTAGRKASAKTAAAKATVKKAPAKRGAKKAELSTGMHVQFAGKSFVEADLVKIAKDVWKYDLKQKVSDLTSVELYVKPEESLVYYVMNKDFTGSFII